MNIIKGLSWGNYDCNLLGMELTAQVFSSEDVLALSQSESLGDGDDSKDEDYFPSSEDTSSTFSEFSQVGFDIFELLG